MRKKVFILAVFLSFLFVACSAKKTFYDYDNKKEISSIGTISEECIPNLILRPGMSSLSLTMTLSSLNENEIGNNLRCNSNHYYSIDTLDDGRYLFILYSVTDNNSTLVVRDSFIGSTLVNREEFNKIVKIGTSYEDVVSIDSSAMVEEYRTSNGKNKCYSYHRFDDRSVLWIEYEVDIVEDKKKVKNITELDPENSVITYLLPQDLELITG